MKQYLTTYYQEINQKLITQKNFTKDEIKDHLTKIQFFQHERLIHLIVTLFYALFALLSFLLAFIHPLLLIIPTLLLIFLIFYVVHYFFLENTVQALYKQYDQMKACEKKRSIF